MQSRSTYFFFVMIVASGVGCCVAACVMFGFACACALAFAFAFACASAALASPLRSDMAKIMGMSARLRALLLLIVLLWQSVAVLGSVTVAQRASEMTHLTVHAQDDDHHHHADHALHMETDPSDEGAGKHLHADSGSHPAGLLNAPLTSLAYCRAVSPAEQSHALWLSPTLEGPLRPPMPSA